jgi:uncharacterized protein involved in exopolysaccharide biosynthesis
MHDPMTTQPTTTDDLSVFSLGAAILRARHRVVLAAVAGAVLLVVPVLRKPERFSATVAFVPQAAEGQRAGLAGLAGQFGVSLGGGNPSQSPEFYRSLLLSRGLLRPLVRDTFEVAEMGGRRLPFLELFGVAGDSMARREDDAIRMLQGTIEPVVDKGTGIIRLGVPTPWPSVSRQLASRLIDGVNRFNVQTRQTQAAAERRFAEGRVKDAQDLLRAAEARQTSFLQSNRAITESPTLLVERDRLQREVAMRQQVVTGLMQALEDARVREVRDTPVISLVESVDVSTRPDPRGIPVRVVAGTLLGAVVALVWTVFALLVSSERTRDAAPAAEFSAAMAEARAEWRRWGGLLRRRADG